MLSSPLFAGSLLALAGAGALVFFGSYGFYACIVALVGVALAVISFQENKRNEKMRDAADRYLSFAADATQTPSHQLRRLLGTMRFSGSQGQNITRLADALIAQLDGADREYRRYLELLGSRMRPGEMTYDRYATAGKRVYDFIIAAIGAAAQQLPALGEVTPGKLPGRVPGTSLALPKGPDGEREAEAPQREAWVVATIEKNEYAISQMQRINGALGAWGQSAQKNAFGESLQDLEELEQRVRRYGA